MRHSITPGSMIIAFTGPATCGKTTAAKALVDSLGFKRLSFADPIRNMLRGLGLTDSDFHDGKNRPIEWLGGKTPRQLMQSIGTEWGRLLVHPEIWMSMAQRKIAETLTAGQHVVFDDCRFDNEARLVRDLGGIVVLIEREGCQVMKHASEAGVSSELVSMTITNREPSPTMFQALVLNAVKAKGCFA